MTTHITKTWFDGEKVVTKEIPESEVYKQKPVAWADMDVRGEDKGLSWTPGQFHTQPLYTAPQSEIERLTKLCYEYLGELTALRAVEQMREQRKPLTDEQIDAVMPYCHNEFDLHEFRSFARSIEEAHGIGERK